MPLRFARLPGHHACAEAVSATEHPLQWGAEALWEQLSPQLPGLSVEVVARIASTNTALLERARIALPLDDTGERRSIFEPMADGTTRLVAALVARWAEEAGKEDPAIRGMPLGMPSLSPEDVQLVETWIAQGHSPD